MPNRLELCFWLFLTNTRSAQQDWFRSKFFYIWVIGSVCAITYMPVVTALGRDDPLKVGHFPSDVSKSAFVDLMWDSVKRGLSWRGAWEA